MRLFVDLCCVATLQCMLVYMYAVFILVYSLQSISKAAVYYVEETHIQLRNKRFYDNPDTAEFEITEPVCTLL